MKTNITSSTKTNSQSLDYSSFCFQFNLCSCCCSVCCYWI